ncbi:MAG: phage holin family protein [Myxococcales bacterium]|nr:phage holin family protein [Myxococcales bacterium]MCB9519735.1 phage holin family protein [Myxococcales bacterium]MCB9530426.1 phage holin family protein [Myxococcales bacterium]MCB9533673.1 phage holin family protein [Myxococcales bacterium]
MFSALVHLAATAAALLVVANVVPGIRVSGWKSAAIGALVVGIVNAVVWPVAVALTFPLTLVSLGTFLVVLNALMLMLVAALVPGMTVSGFIPAVIGSVLLSVLNWGIDKIF